MRAKPTPGFSCTVALVLVLGTISAVQLRSMHRTTDEITTRRSPAVSLTRPLRALMNEFRMQEFEHTLAANERAPASRPAAGTRSASPSDRCARWSTA